MLDVDGVFGKESCHSKSIIFTCNSFNILASCLVQYKTKVNESISLLAAFLCTAAMSAAKMLIQ